MECTEKKECMKAKCATCDDGIRCRRGKKCVMKPCGNGVYRYCKPGCEEGPRCE